MACGATLKRTMDFDPLMSPASPKRRRCIPVAPSASSPRRYLSMEPSPFGESSSRLSAGKLGYCWLNWPPGWPVSQVSDVGLSNVTDELSPLSVVSPEQILNSIKQEYKRIQRRKHLDGGHQQLECCYSPDSPSQLAMNVSNMAGWWRSNKGLFYYSFPSMCWLKNNVQLQISLHFKMVLKH